MKTEVFNLSKITPAQIDFLKTNLLSGAPCILPTDTVYGLMVLGSVQNAANILNKTKNNPPQKPAQILCTLRQAKLFAADFLQFEQARKLWPGALTAILTASKEGKKYTNIDTVGLRVPKSDFLLNLMEELKAPLLASSANLHGKTPCKNDTEILAVFDGIVPCIVLDDGKKPNTPSKIIDYTQTPPKIIR